MKEILESLPDNERVAYTTVQTLVYRLEEKGALRRPRRCAICSALQVP